MTEQDQQKSGLLEGNELEGNIGKVGNYVVDVDAKGNIKAEAVISQDLGHTKLSSTNVIETNIFKLAEEITKKTGTPWDDKALALIKSVLGIED